MNFEYIGHIIEQECWFKAFLPEPAACPEIIFVF